MKNIKRSINEGGLGLIDINSKVSCMRLSYKIKCKMKELDREPLFKYFYEKRMEKSSPSFYFKMYKAEKFLSIKYYSTSLNILESEFENKKATTKLYTILYVK